VTRVRFLSVYLLPALVAVYTVRYARWAAARGFYRGAFGLYLLALLTVAVPALVSWWTG
jgi:hypothetical protein